MIPFAFMCRALDGIGELAYTREQGRALLGDFGDVLLCHGRLALFQTYRAQSQVLEFVEFRLLEAILRAVESAPVNGEDRQGGPGALHDAANASTDTSETEHLSRALPRELAGCLIGDSDHVSGPRTGENQFRPPQQQLCASAVTNSSFY